MQHVKNTRLNLDEINYFHFHKYEHLGKTIFKFTIDKVVALLSTTIDFHFVNTPFSTFMIVINKKL